jgi:hypothetical protein
LKLPQLAKVLEKIQLQLNCADLTLKDNQHAFLKGRSTISALIEISQKWFEGAWQKRTQRMAEKVSILFSLTLAKRLIWWTTEFSFLNWPL